MRLDGAWYIAVRFQFLHLEFAMGYGEGLTLSDAKRAAEKDAKERLGAKSTHHIQCRCIGPNGDRIIPHG